MSFLCCISTVTTELFESILLQTSFSMLTAKKFFLKMRENLKAINIYMAPSHYMNHGWLINCTLKTLQWLNPNTKFSFKNAFENVIRKIAPILLTEWVQFFWSHFQILKYPDCMSFKSYIKVSDLERMQTERMSVPIIFAVQLLDTRWKG